MTEKDFAFGTEDLESAEYLLSMVGGIASLMETTGEGCTDHTESMAWSAMAINYLLDEAQECIQKGKATIARARAMTKALETRAAS